MVALAAVSEWNVHDVCVSAAKRQSSDSRAVVSDSLYAALPAGTSMLPQAPLSDVKICFPLRYSTAVAVSGTGKGPLSFTAASPTPPPKDGSSENDQWPVPESLNSGTYTDRVS